MTLEEIWRRKDDDVLVAASHRLEDYTEDGRRTILAELERRRAAGTIEPALEREASQAVPLGAGVGDAALEQVPRRFISRLWYGYVPLVWTFWGLGTGVGFILLVVIALGARWPILGLAGALLAIGHFVFMNVAIWRSAGRYDGSPIWGHLARIAVAAGIARTVVQILF